MLRLQHLAPDQRQGDTDLTIIAVGFQVIRGDGDADGIEAAAAERAGLGEGHEIGTVLAANLQHDGGLGAFALPVPVLGVDQAPCPARLRQHDDAGAAIGILGRLQTRTDLRTGKLDDFRARIEQSDVLEGNAGAFGDATHLLDIGWLEAFDDGQIVAHQRGDAARIQRQLLELGKIMRSALADAIGGEPPILTAALMRGTGNFNQGKRFDHLWRQVPLQFGRA